MDFSILIITKDRPEYITRLIDYYSSSSYPGKIVIVDSSSNHEQIKGLCESSGLGINLLYHPPGDITGAWKACLSSATTTYAAFSGDDDLLPVQGIRECVEFLQSNPGFDAAYGLRINYWTEDDTIHSPIISQMAFSLPNYSSVDPLSRLSAYLANGRSTFYFISKLSLLTKAYTGLSGTRYIVDEFLPCCLMVLYGRCAPIASTSHQIATCIFQSKRKNSLWSKHLLWELVIDNNLEFLDSWREAHELYTRIMSGALMEIGMTREQAVPYAMSKLYGHMSGVLLAQSLAGSQQDIIPPPQNATDAVIGWTEAKKVIDKYVTP